MNSRDMIELANKIETRARDVNQPAFDDLIEENWKVIVAALRAASSLRALAELPPRS